MIFLLGSSTSVVIFRLSLPQSLHFKGFYHFSVKPVPWSFSTLDENCPLWLEIPINWLVSHIE